MFVKEYRLRNRRFGAQISIVASGLLMICLATFGRGVFGQEINADPSGRVAAEKKRVSEYRENLERNWAQMRDAEWPKLVKSGSEANRGAQISMRRLKTDVDDGQTVSILVQIRNVGDRAVPFVEGGFEPSLWIHDSAGNPIAMKKAGIAYYTPGPRVGSVFYTSIEPGDCRGILYRADEHFILKPHGKYQAIGANVYYDFLYGPFTCVLEPEKRLVSKPLALDLNLATEIQAAKDRKAVLATPKASEMTPFELTDQWEKYSRISGEMAESCVLEAELSPLNSKELFVSLCHEDPKKGSVVVPMIGVSARDYEILVRNSRGHIDSLFGSVSNARRENDESEGHSGNKASLKFGDGIGTIIALRRWISVAPEGEYTMLVGLPSRGTNGPTWVAEPLKIQVRREAVAPRPASGPRT